MEGMVIELRLHDAYLREESEYMDYYPVKTLSMYLFTSISINLHIC